MIPVAAATPVVAPWRERLDVSAVHGVPADITVLYPFVDPVAITGDHLAQLAALFASTPAFDFVLDRVGYFDDSVVYLAPTPPDPFVALTRRLVDHFPGYPPYGGAYDETTPHLTVGDRGALDELHRAAAAVEPALPIGARATEVWLLVSGPARRANRARQARREGVRGSCAGASCSAAPSATTRPTPDNRSVEGERGGQRSSGGERAP